MVRKIFIAIMLIFFLSFMYSPTSAQVPLLLQVPQQYFEAKPGETVSVPVTLVNTGNESIENITIHVSGPLVKGLLYGQEYIEKLEAGETMDKTLSIYVQDVRAGVYDLKIIAKVGVTFIEVPISLRVLTQISYSADIDVGNKYIFGQDVTITLLVSSSSNGVIFGDVSYEIYRNNNLIAQRTVRNIFLYPDPPRNKWEYPIFIPRPSVGNYTVIMRSTFRGLSRTVTKSFLVYQRVLSYEAKFENGVISVKVTDEHGNRVGGIPVNIEGTQLQTNSYGIAFIEANKPGTYRITLNLDGKIVETFVEVKRLFLDYEQRNETLLVYVRDSSGVGIPKASVEAIGPLGKSYGTTDENGTALINLNETGFGSIRIKAENDAYIGAEAVVDVKKPQPPETETPSPSTTSPIPTSTNQTTTPVSPLQPKDYGNLPLILILSAVLFGSTSYIALFRPLKFEEQMDKYYFVKIKAPRLREIQGFTYEKAIDAVDARATKGEVTIENGKVIWKIEKLEPGEEAFLQVLL
ncbi:hypothetical protein DRN51_03840 [Thermococci archaeon]|nr:MAG: hypothetical protein DRN51_03840 [Thermococci archaeon]